MKKLIILFLFFGILMSHQRAFCQDQGEEIIKSPSRDTALAIKVMLMEMFEVSGIPAVHSRKSCNCGCNIKKESYVISPYVSFASYDFCDSQVFEWKGEEGDALELIQNIIKKINLIGYNGLNGEIKDKYKFKITKYSVETADLLTFIEASILKDGSIFFKMSVATP